jgi:uncharacterized protein YcbX
LTPRVIGIHRYPVKSMRGEEPDRVWVDALGVAGDRAFAVRDVATGLVASAKYPRRWAGLLAVSARIADAGHVELTGADGSAGRGDDPDVDRWLTAHLDRAVTLAGAAQQGACYELEWPEVVDLAPDRVIEYTRTGTSPDGRPVSTLQVSPKVPGTYHDVAPVALLTTASLRTAAARHPGGDWQVDRFRPNFVLDVPGDGFAENEWHGRRLRLGDAVLEVEAPTARCVMTTLPQTSLPEDRSILRTLARANRRMVEPHGRFACFGAYASVVTPGHVTLGAEVELLDAAPPTSS